MSMRTFAETSSYFQIVQQNAALLLWKGEYHSVRKCLKVLQDHLVAEESESVTNCYQLKKLTLDGKMRLTGFVDTKPILYNILSVTKQKSRVIQTIADAKSNDESDMLLNNTDYFEALEDIKSRIKSAQYKAVLGANKELIELYWNIGQVIIAKECLNYKIPNSEVFTYL